MVVYTTKDGDFEVEAEDLQVFMQRYPNAQKVGGEIEEQKDRRESIKKEIRILSN